jgi:hypothetical protein
MSAVPGIAPRTASMPYGLLAAYVGLYLIFWVLLPLLLGQTPPPDNFEQLNWALHPALGYAKHPPLPTLVLWAVERVLPAGIPLTYALGGAMVLSLLAVAWLAVRESLGPRAAWVAVPLITLVSYHTLRLHYYNHNTTLLAATAVAALCCWRAVRGSGTAWWAGLGAAWAAGMLCKYQMVLGIGSNVAFAALMLRSRPRELVRGLAIAGAVAAVGFAPHLAWLAMHRFPTLDYAAGVLGSHLSVLGRIDSLARFLASQASRLVGCVLAVALLHGLGAGPGERGPAPGSPPLPAPDAGVWFWRIHAFGPLVLMALMALVGGVDLEMHWGTAYLWALVPWYLSTRRGARLEGYAPVRVLAVVGAVQALLMTGKVLFPEL